MLKGAGWLHVSGVTAALGAQAAEAATLVAVARILMNLDEFINRE